LEDEMANPKIKSKNLSVCPQCKSAKLPHRVCPTCGHYKGKEVVSVDIA
jgi:large subunit ribosomal protein L32